MFTEHCNFSREFLRELISMCLLERSGILIHSHSVVYFSLRTYRCYQQIVKFSKSIHWKHKLLPRLYIFFYIKRRESSPKRIRYLDNYHIGINFVPCDISLMYGKRANLFTIKWNIYISKRNLKNSNI